jgi:SAM-dependent methyltransferase
VNRPPSPSRAAGRPRQLNLGSGRKPLAGAVNVDRVVETSPDAVCDLDRRPWPFAAGCFDEVCAYDVLEHLDDLVATMEEIHRVCRDGAVIRITLPHFSSANAFTDPTHRHKLGYFSFHYFTGENDLGFYTRRRFRRRASRIVFYPGLAGRVLTRLANRYPAAWERRWAWVFPAWFLYFELEVVKAG